MKDDGGEGSKGEQTGACLENVLEIPNVAGSDFYSWYISLFDDSTDRQQGC